MRRERRVTRKRKLPGPEVAGNISYLSSEAAMMSDVTARQRGSLNRATLAMLAKFLQDYLDEVRKQEVPERFKLLLRGPDTANRRALVHRLCRDR